MWDSPLRVFDRFSTCIHVLNKWKTSIVIEHEIHTIIHRPPVGQDVQTWSVRLWDGKRNFSKAGCSFAVSDLCVFAILYCSCLSAAALAAGCWLLLAISCHIFKCSLGPLFSDILLLIIQLPHYKMSTRTPLFGHFLLIIQLPHFKMSARTPRFGHFTFDHSFITLIERLQAE